MSSRDVEKKQEGLDPLETREKQNQEVENEFTSNEEEIE
jgi:hypothetical protein